MSEPRVERIAEFRGLPESDKAKRRAEVRVLVITGLGLNCEVETEAAFRIAGARPERVHLLDLLDGAAGKKLSDYPVVAFVGGFAFGDHMGAGFVFANKIRWHLYDDLLAFLDRGGLAIGICNGFQTMVRLGLLPGFDGDYRTPLATLAPNDRLGYRNAWVTLGFDVGSPCVWTRDLTRVDLPSRHGEGKLLSTAETLDRLEAAGQVVLRYLGPQGQPTTEWPHNPNGSPRGIAGICDPSGRLFGLMPHPDAFLYPYQHPQWPRRRLEKDLPAEGGGVSIFRNGVDWVASSM
jgi:phosphoribosylformylglycinamidine synthase